jgi:hypothetical protein
MGIVKRSPKMPMVLWNKSELSIHALVAGALIASGLAAFWKHHVQDMRGQYLAANGSMEIFESLYFDDKALSVTLPAFVILLGFAVASAIISCRQRKRISYPAGFLFWSLWLIALGMWFL